MFVSLDCDSKYGGGGGGSVEEDIFVWEGQIRKKMDIAHY
jgi:hypothetical protein